MVIYEKKEFSSVPLERRALINDDNIIVALSIVTVIIIGFVTSWGALFYVVTVYVLGNGVVHWYAIRKSRAIVIETRENDLRIVYRKYFSVSEVVIKNEDVKLELYEESYGTSFTHPLYLYIYSWSDKNIDIELNDGKYSHAVTETLLQIYKENKIQLQSRELNYIEKYREQKRWNRSPMGKMVTLLKAGLWLAVIIFILLYL